jgi:hypothetical protein
MRADLYQGANGTWELDVYEIDGPGRITNCYKKEEDVRRALQTAYEYGRRHGSWRVQTADDYYVASLPKSRPSCCHPDSLGAAGCTSATLSMYPCDLAATGDHEGMKEEAPAPAPAPGHKDPVVVAACPARLGAEATAEDMAAVLLAEPALSEVRELGIGMQSEAWLGRLFETATLNARVQAGRMNELMVFRATLGEQLSQASAALTEALLWEHTRRKMAHDAEHEMAQRAMAELATYYLLGAGHSLANICARLLATDRALEPELRTRTGKIFEVGSVDEVALELNKDRAKELDQVAATAASPALRECAKPLRALVINQDWKDLVVARHLDYHRFRVQSYGAATGSPSNPWRKTEGGTATLSLRSPANTSESERLAEERTRLALDAMRALGKAVEDFDERFAAYREELNLLNADPEPESTDP